MKTCHPKEWKGCTFTWITFLPCQICANYKLHLNKTDLPSLQLTFSHLKICGWNTIVSFWESLFQGGYSLSLGWPCWFNCFHTFPMIPKILATGRPDGTWPIQTFMIKTSPNVLESLCWVFPFSQTTCLFGHKPFPDVCVFFTSFNKKNGTWLTNNAILEHDLQSNTKRCWAGWFSVPNMFIVVVYLHTASVLLMGIGVWAWWCILC